MGRYVKKNLRHDSTEYLGPVNSWKALGFAVVHQAVLDWREAKLQMSNIATVSHAAYEKLKSAEDFFLSPMCDFYSGLDGKTILRKLKEGVL